MFTIEPGYPAALAAIEPPPPLLYVKGETGLLARPMLAIVGSRQCSAAGQKLARRLAADLGRAGLVIVSGLARGIDGAAHEAALESGSVAVVAGGIDVIYPPEHDALQKALGERGCLVSEQPPGFQPRSKDFPKRNRIIAGISMGVIVIEAARRSGSLYTARRAADYGRDVFAVPGHPLDPRAEGTNSLLKTGATLVTEAEDVISALAPFGRFPDQPIKDEGGLEAASETRERPPAAPTESERDQLIGLLGPAPVDTDELVRASRFSPRLVQALLLELDLAGRIERHGAHLVSLTDTDAAR